MHAGMVYVPFGLSPAQLRTIGLASVALGIGLLTIYWRSGVDHQSAMITVFFVFTGGLAIGYGSALTAVERSDW